MNSVFLSDVLIIEVMLKNTFNEAVIVVVVILEIGKQIIKDNIFINCIFQVYLVLAVIVTLNIL